MTSYPSGTVRELLESDAVTAPTRAALEKRLQPADAAPLKFFNAEQMTILRAAAARLVPQTQGREPVDLITEIDHRLAKRTGNGWRFASLPPDEQAYELGLRGLEQSATELFGVSFVALRGHHQDEILARVQKGNAPGDIWRSLNAARFFEELLADLAEAYYSHPLAQEEIGYVGMADKPGWTRIGLDQLEDREPRKQAFN